MKEGYWSKAQERAGRVLQILPSYPAFHRLSGLGCDRFWITSLSRVELGDHLNQRHGAGGRFTNPPFLPFSNFQGTTSIAQHHLGPAKSHIYHTGTSIWQMANVWILVKCDHSNKLLESCSGSSGNCLQFWQFPVRGIRQVDSGSLWRLVTACLEILQSDLVALFKSMTEKNLNGLKDLKQRNTTHSALSPPEINTKTEQGWK